LTEKSQKMLQAVRLMENSCLGKGDKCSYRELVENNIGLVGHVVNSFAPRNKQEDEEFYGQGC